MGKTKIAIDGVPSTAQGVLDLIGEMTDQPPQRIEETQPRRSEPVSTKPKETYPKITVHKDYSDFTTREKVEAISSALELLGEPTTAYQEQIVQGLVLERLMLVLGKSVVKLISEQQIPTSLATVPRISSVGRKRTPRAQVVEFAEDDYFTPSAIAEKLSTPTHPVSKEMVIWALKQLRIYQQTKAKDFIAIDGISVNNPYPVCRQNGENGIRTIDKVQDSLAYSPGACMVVRDFMMRTMWEKGSESDRVPPTAAGPDAGRFLSKRRFGEWYRRLPPESPFHGLPIENW